MTVRAILTPPQEDAFRDRCAVSGELESCLHGYSKRVLLSADRVFAFPRDRTKVEALDREAAALLALDDCDLTPGLLGRHDDAEISPFPFLELERMSGSPFYGAIYEPVQLDVVLDLMSQLGSAIAVWHEDPVDRLAVPLTEPIGRPHGLLERALRGKPEAVAAEAATALGRSEIPAWIDAIAAVQEMAPVLTHGDVHGEQLMMSDGALTSVIDWETAAIDNPVRDIDFREWGRGWARAHGREFSILREALWSSYTAARPSASLPDWRTVDSFFSLIEAWRHAAGE